MVRLDPFLAFAQGALVLTLVGCETYAPPFPEGQGQARNLPSYPSGPFGTTKGSVIRNYSLIGMPSPDDSTAAVSMALQDFYDPTGEGVYPEGSPYSEGPLPKALLITLGATWCGPCKEEAENVLPQLHASLRPTGAQFLFVLVEGDPGSPATEANLSAWVNAFDSSWPQAIDPSQDFRSAYGTSFPINLVVDPKTMTIVELRTGLLTGEDDPIIEAISALTAPPT